MKSIALACPSCGQAPTARADLRALQGEGLWRCEDCSDDDDDCDFTGAGPWSDYPLGSTTNFSETQEFPTVAHVTHIDSAIGIVEDDSISTRSKLLISDHKEIEGCWAGVDAFGEGTAFGNVSFDLDFKALIQGKLIHWLEPLEKKIRRFRFVVSDQEVIPGLLRYDPDVDDKRPWFYDRILKKHFCRSDSKYGFFLVGGIGRHFWRKVRFADHHPLLCSRLPDHCESLGKSRAVAREEFYQMIEKKMVDLSKVAGILE